MDLAPAPTAPSRWRRAAPWVALVAMLAVAQTLLVLLTIRHEAQQAQEAADEVAAEVAADARADVSRLVQVLQATSALHGMAAPEAEVQRALFAAHPALVRLERRDDSLAVVAVAEPPGGASLFADLDRDALDHDVEAACGSALRGSTPRPTRSFFAPGAGGRGAEVIDVCLPLALSGRGDGFVVATISLASLLEAALAQQRDAPRFELSLMEADGARLARAGRVRGAGVYRGEHLLDIAGQPIVLRADSARGPPSLIPNVATALVLGLSIALFALVLLLARDVRRRAKAEASLAEALAFRQAMEDSLVTGLRALDLEGRISYTNPAFRAMVGFDAATLAAAPPDAPPYWPPEHAAEYRSRRAARLSATRGSPAREGHETLFLRAGGERFPVRVYEAPLVDGLGRHAGWMSAVLDITEQRRAEDLARQRQERLQATARLATMGEMASLLSHELNQPLAAIASYAAGSINLLDDEAADEPASDRPGAGTDALSRPMLRDALARIAEQAERAGRVIKSVHAFVRRREQAREVFGADVLVESVLPLVRMQARKTGAVVEVQLPRPAPRVHGDRTMIEQVLLNLARNGLQAMDTPATPPESRALVIAVEAAAEAGRVAFSVSDMGPGIPPEVAERLFTPFFSTREEGMGLGLSLCRTVVEQHGGTLAFDPARERSPAGGPEGGGTTFRFTLPAAAAPPAPRAAGARDDRPEPMHRAA
jgi:two-component system sensor histidine kinase DctS